MRKVKTLTISEYELPIVVKKEKMGGFVARCSIWNDCYAQGETIEEVISEISLVATSLIELYQEEERKIPLKLKSTSKKSEDNVAITFPIIVSTQ